MDRRKTKAEIVLGSLLRGQRVRIQDITYCMSDDFELCTVGFNFTTKQEAYIKVLADSLSSFCKFCESLPDEEVYLISANNVLQEMI